MARTRTRSVDQPNENADQDMDTEQNSAVVSDSRRRRRRVEETDQVTPSTSTSRKDRPTPSARQVKPRGAATGLVYRIPVVRGIVTYFKGVISELQKVTWPNREETTRLTTVVLGVTVAFAIVLGILDTFLAWWFQQAFSETSELVFLAIAAGVVVVAGGAYTVLRNRL